jgi:hypothetical protein
MLLSHVILSGVFHRGAMENGVEGSQAVHEHGRPHEILRSVNFRAAKIYYAQNDMGLEYFNHVSTASRMCSATAFTSSKYLLMRLRTG